MLYDVDANLTCIFFASCRNWTRQCTCPHRNQKNTSFAGQVLHPFDVFIVNFVDLTGFSSFFVFIFVMQVMWNQVEKHRTKELHGLYSYEGPECGWRYCHCGNNFLLRLCFNVNLVGVGRDVQRSKQCFF